MCRIEHSQPHWSAGCRCPLGDSDPADLFGTLQRNAERSVTVTTFADEARRGVKECVHIRAPAKVQS